ncbi:hypothetical protein FNF31_03074 [Cafeteria roenbergensis]|uniref:Uncharacterized protein n=1 Tax=Cafeteria roenbergensis TaxID=33653 RepID=A0A5A8DF28_CAFRO|nr:hypothetical protein FNF31_03074 [Cafeteria roenbergensis]KAA0165592.1 hypothetical protein FNF28_03444 [Cafeteria roenbergensis]
MASFADLLAEHVSEGAVTDEFEVDVGRKLGTGGYANVYLGKRRSDGTPVAIKVMKQFRWTRPGAEELAVLREIGFMRKISELDTPHLLGAVAAYGRIFDVQRLCIVTPLCAGGDLFERIAGMGRYTERTAAARFRDMMVGLQRLHEAGILHRDIKPENLLLSARGDDDAVSVIADFGLSDREDECGPESGRPASRQLVGTLAYNAPEHLGRHPVWSPAGDVWSAGVVLFIMLGGSPPFYVDHRMPKRSHDEALKRVIREGKFVFYPSLFGTVSDRAKDLISGMLHVDPARRLTVDQCLAHPWLADNDANPDVALDAGQRELRLFNAKRKLRAAALACRWGARSPVHSALKDLVGGTSFSEAHIKAIARAFNEAKAADAAAAGAAAGASAATAAGAGGTAPAPAGKASLSRMSELTADRSQFERVMESLGFGGLPLGRMWELFDTDESGSVDVREVVAGLATLRSGGEDALQLCFDVLDADGSGHLEREELAIALSALAGAGAASDGEDADEAAAHLAFAFEAMDVNKDGRISLEEFKAGIAADPSLVGRFLRPLDSLGGDSSRALRAVADAAASPKET